MKCKITVEIDDKKTVWESDNVQMNQQRDVLKEFPIGEDGKVKFKPGDSFLNIFSINAVFLPHESSPEPTIEEAFKVDNGPNKKGE